MRKKRKDNDEMDNTEETPREPETVEDDATSAGEAGSPPSPHADGRSEAGSRRNGAASAPPLTERLVAPAAWLGVACLLASLTVWAVQNNFGWAAKGLLVAAVLLIGQFLALRWTSVRRAFSLRSTRLGATSAVTVLLVIGILGFANYIASRHSARVDLTEKKRFSLSEQTTSILNGLQKDIKLVAIAGLGDPRFGQTQDLFKQYAHASPRIKTQILDPDADRAGIEDYMDLNPSLGSVIVTAGDKRELVYTPGEEGVTSAILKVTTDKKKKMYFLKGHGEKAIEDYAETGLSQAKQRLDKEQFDVSELALAGKTDVPADCDTLVIAGPQRPFLPEETAAIEKYLTAGGSLMIMLEPPPAPSLNEILSRYNVKADDDMVWDVTCYRSETEPVATQFMKHKVTERPGFLALIRARSLETTNPMPPPQQPGMPPQPPPGPNAVALAQSSEYAQSLPPKPGGGFADKGTTRQLALAVAVSEEKPPAQPGMPEPPEPDNAKKPRLIVVGDSDFATNDFFMQSRLFNADFFLNSVAWLATEEKLISIRPKDPDVRTVTLTRNQKTLTFIICVLLVPLAVVGSGVVVWWRRRG